MSDPEESKKLRQQGHYIDQLAEAFRWAKRDVKVVPIRNSGIVTDQSNGHGNSSVHFSDRAGLYVAVLALAVAVYAVSKLSDVPLIVDSKVQAGMAQASKEMQAEVAKANAVAHTAETHARVALDKVETAEVELGKKGINIRTDGH